METKTLKHSLNESFSIMVCPLFYFKIGTNQSSLYVIYFKLFFFHVTKQENARSIELISDNNIKANSILLPL